LPGAIQLKERGFLMADLPLVLKCSFCGEDARLVDRRKSGLWMIVAGCCAGGLTGWYFGWVVGLMDFLILLALGLFWALRSDRFVYRCRECTNVMTP
jgi:hypothetical protein